MTTNTQRSRQMGKPTIAVETVTPEQAAAYLAENTRNRALGQNRVNSYAGAMRRGEWMLNGETIKFNGDRTLLDGQHRLAAVVKAGTPQQFLVVRGLTSVAQDTIDTGRARTFADVLRIRGETYHTTIAAAMRVIWSYEQDGIPVYRHVVITNQQLLDCWNRHQDGIRESLSAGGAMGKGVLLLPSSIVTALHYLFASVDQEDADAFFKLLATGDGLEFGDPIFALRDRFIREMADHKRLKSVVMTAFTVRAFNAWRAGERMTKLQWKPGGARPDRFPAIEGCTIPVRRRPEEDEGE